MPDEAAAQPQEKNKLRGPMFTIIIVVIVALLEGGIFFIAFKFFGSGPGAAYGDDQSLLEQQATAEIKTTEYALLTGYRVQNNKTGQPIIYDFDLTVIIPADDAAQETKIKEALDSNLGQIKDRVGRIVRGQQPRVLNEDDYHTLKTQFKDAITEILQNPDAVIEVLIPRCVPMPAG